MNVRMLDCLGRMVAKWTNVVVTNGVEQFDFPIDIEKGIYFLEVSSSGGKVVKKIGVW